MRNTLGPFAVLRLSVLTIAVLVAVGTASASARSAYRWPRIQEQGYITNCIRTSGGKLALCRCQMQWLERRYSFKQISAIYLHRRKALILLLTKASLACLK